MNVKSNFELKLFDVKGGSGRAKCSFNGLIK
jgi:hypothetical protein